MICFAKSILFVGVGALLVTSSSYAKDVSYLGSIETVRDRPYLGSVEAERDGGSYLGSAKTVRTAKDGSYLGSVEALPQGNKARGKVFLDVNRNSTKDMGESGVAGVAVSNGREVVVTDIEGNYELPAYDDMNVFISIPADYATPVDENMVPQFAYIHKIDGSPKLRFGGIEATGSLPAAINFPLIEAPVGDTFECLFFGDTQPYTNQEVSYVRETVGKLLASRDNSTTECLIFLGDVMGDDLSLFPRFKKITSVGKVPQYFVPGNHDLDFDAENDQDSLDTFRREWGPEYYSFNHGKVHFVVLDNVRYPCNGLDPHSFCSEDKKPTYNGVISERQLEWLKNDLAKVPQDNLIVLNVHIPLVTFTSNTSQKHQMDNLPDLVKLLEGRKVVSLAGHTHTTEQILPGESFDGWEENTGVAEAKFHQIIAGAVSGSWWAGDFNDQGVPRSTQRLGSPRGYYSIEFSDNEYIDTFHKFDASVEEQMHASFNTPRFRGWMQQLIAFTEISNGPSDILPPVTINDLGDMNMLTLSDLQFGTWLAINVWNGSKDSRVVVSINGSDPVEAIRTQKGEGEKKLSGPEYADPLALAMQATVGRVAFRSAWTDETAGHTIWTGVEWQGTPGPFVNWMLTKSSSHLWRLDMDPQMELGVHRADIETTDRYGRKFNHNLTFEVVESVPNMKWQKKFWEKKE